ncbi:Maf family protein [Hydrogenophaga sp. 5NK40-0174]|uniref:Maf family protein n=1 Tax=Hydrogenophaga sp. 5NK40-0174 TaxID=3127649 RepID=UPI003108DB45
MSWIYLASQSPRRRQLLEQWNVQCELLLPGDDDDTDAEALEEVLPGESPLRYVERVTRLKLDAALARLRRRGLPPAPVLCADTTVALGREILGKPESPIDAARMLGRLSGQQHRVLTSVAVGVVRSRKDQAWQATSRSTVTFEALAPARIKRYVNTGEPMGKAGAYAIQGLAATWVSHMTGSYSGIMGLPAHETAKLLEQAGIRVL